MIVKIGDKIRMSEKGISMGISTNWVPLGTVGKIVGIDEDDTVAVEFESDPSNNWWYRMEDAIADRI